MLELIWALAAIIMIDIVLAGDNALVIGMVANRLPEHQRQKVILWGTAGAVAVRFLMIAVLSYLLLIPGLKLIGGLALIYIGWKLAFADSEHDVKASDTFWGAIGTVVVADAVMGLDNALGIAAAANGNFALVVAGLLISVPIILFGSTLVSKLLARYPDCVFLGSGVLFVVATQMILKESFIDSHVDELHDFYEHALPWVVAVVLTAKQYYRARIRKNTA
jgi:YjbE family integral membrane protein